MSKKIRAIPMYCRGWRGFKNEFEALQKILKTISPYAPTVPVLTFPARL